MNVSSGTSSGHGTNDPIFQKLNRTQPYHSGSHADLVQVSGKSPLDPTRYRRSFPIYLVDEDILTDMTLSYCLRVLPAPDLLYKEISDTSSFFSSTPLSRRSSVSLGGLLSTTWSSFGMSSKEARLRLRRGIHANTISRSNNILWMGDASTVQMTNLGLH